MIKNFQDVLCPPMQESAFKEINPIVLAFIGDGVHTLYVRDKVVKNSNLLVNKCHVQSAKFCNAKSQANKLNGLMEHLNETELDIVRRARNAKTNNIAKNSDVETYKKATSFEALIGYLYLKGDFDRLNFILKF